MRDKVNNGNELSGVGIDESLHPFVRSGVHDLNDVGENNRLIRLNEIFQRGRMVVVLSAKSHLCLSNGVGDGEGWAGGRDSFYIVVSVRPLVTLLNHSLGVTKEEPKETTRLRASNATFATAFAKETPF